MKMIANPSQLSREYVTACEMYLLAQAHLQQVKADIEPIRQRVIESNNFRATHRFRRGQEYVTSFTHDYLMSDADFLTYLGEVIPQVRELGYKVSPDPNEYGCPISAAEGLLMEVKYYLLCVCVEELELFPAEDLNRVPLKRRDELADTLVKLAIPRVRAGEQIVASLLPEKARGYYEKSARHH